MTITTIWNAVALGTTTELIGNTPTKTTLATGTTAVILNTKLVPGDGNNQSDMVRIYYAVSPFSLTADATLPFNLKPQCGVLELKTQKKSAGAIYETSGVIANNGGFLYTWFDSPALSVAGGSTPSITLTSVELP